MYLSQKENEPIWKSEEREGMMNTFINMSVTLSKHCMQFKKYIVPFVEKYWLELRYWTIISYKVGNEFMDPSKMVDC